MVVDSLRQRSSPAAENSFLMRSASVDSKVGETEMNGEGAKGMNFRRERMKLRRIRSLAGSTFAGDSILFSDCDANLKKRRSEIQKESKLIADTKFSSTIAATSRSHGLISVIGRRRQMEDAVAVELGFVTKGKKSYDFFGVYDGHGGYRVARACREMLHKLLANIVAEEISSEGIIDWEKVMIAGFKKMDEEVNKNGTAVATMGSTAVVAVVGDDKVVVANCGDSRAVISRGGVAVQLLDDHKPDRPDELERIELSGGRVINWNGQRVLGVLATSRSIGDQYLKPFVITEPEVKVINTTYMDEFIILASDGLWDVVSNDLACKVARRCLNGQLRRNSQFSKVEEKNDLEGNCQFNEKLNEKSRAFEAAAFLAELAIARGSKDNISITIVELNRRSTSGSII